LATASLPAGGASVIGKNSEFVSVVLLIREMGMTSAPRREMISG